MKDPVYSAFAKIYDIVMRDVDYTSWAKHILRLAKRFDIPSQKILELACGTGGHAIRLARMGCHVTGVDRSETMLSIARKKQVKAEVDVEWHQGDMDSFSLVGLDKDFSLITCLYDSLNYLLDEEEIEHCFQEVHAHLQKGGGFIFDVTTEYNLLQNFSGYTFAENFEHASYIWENDYDIVKKICSSRVTVFIENGGLFEKQVEVHKQRVYPTHLIVELLRETGFEVCGYFHDLTEKPPKNECERIHFVCKKEE